jgi:hypothetical protein
MIPPNFFFLFFFFFWLQFYLLITCKVYAIYLVLLIMIFAIYFPPMFSKILLCFCHNILNFVQTFLSFTFQNLYIVLVIYIFQTFILFYLVQTFILFLHCSYIFFYNSMLHFLSNFIVLCVNENIARTPYLT